jgi:hypothetical protein
VVRGREGWDLVWYDMGVVTPCAIPAKEATGCEKIGRGRRCLGRTPEMGLEPLVARVATCGLAKVRHGRFCLYVCTSNGVVLPCVFPL